ncbi:hypothetical protein, variant [Capsaspora owczarzaki ATCC 30864]|uniref:tRNA-guanine(15) transglycosylase-like domain-containing protein n=1 Tax=Capsaspora owczarzaki (strain ATCC 30864) TaxID=595528 RepID=A0A0D2WV71_CAPO3|nr:hypothetical protein, variant [Capsaspora owczarzaki ATCC 30864]
MLAGFGSFSLLASIPRAILVHSARCTLPARPSSVFSDYLYYHYCCCSSSSLSSSSHYQAMSSFSTAAANNPATAAPVAGPRFQVLHSDQSASGSASGSSTGARTGRLEFNAPDDAHPPRAMLTPSSLFCARLGTPLSLTMDMCRAEPLLAGFHDSLSLLAQNGEQVMRQYGKGIHKFMHADEYIFYMSTRDVLAATVDGMGGDKQVAVDVATGRIKVEPEGFVKYLDVAMPDMVASLSDNIVGGTAGTKRIEKSIQRTDKFLDDTLDRISKLPEGSPAKNVAILAVVQGSQDKASRIRAASTAASKLVFGFLLEGFNTGEDQLQRLELIEAAVVRHLESCFVVHVVRVSDSTDCFGGGIWSVCLHRFIESIATRQVACHSWPECSRTHPPGSLARNRLV